MARYLILIHGSEQEWDSHTDEQLTAKGKAHGAFSEAAGDAKILGAALESVSTATTLRATGGKAPTVTDGPFMEATEVLGGFYVVDVPDLDAALALARLLPELNEEHGAIEVRPIMGG